MAKHYRNRWHLGDCIYSTFGLWRAGGSAVLHCQRRYVESLRLMCLHLGIRNVFFIGDGGEGDEPDLWMGNASPGWTSILAAQAEVCSRVLGADVGEPGVMAPSACGAWAHDLLLLDYEPLSGQVHEGWTPDCFRAAAASARCRGTGLRASLMSEICGTSLALQYFALANAKVVAGVPTGPMAMLPAAPSAKVFTAHSTATLSRDAPWERNFKNLDACLDAAVEYAIANH